jgi:hypothetical protein
VFDYIQTILFFSPFKSDCPLERRDYHLIIDSFRKEVVVFDNNGNLEKITQLIEHIEKTGVRAFHKELMWCEEHQQRTLRFFDEECVMCHYNMTGKKSR